MLRSIKFGLSATVLAVIVGCTPDYSPNTYAANAVQQANKVESGVIVGFREVAISANGTVGAVTGGAAGGILGSQAGNGSMASALGTVGGSVVGSLVGTGIEHATGDATGWEYIVRKPNGDLLSVTQREPMPIPLSQKVLVITGAQARVIADYSIQPEPVPLKENPAPDKPAKEPAAAKPAETPLPPVTPPPTPPAPTPSSDNANSPPTITPNPSPASVPAEPDAVKSSMPAPPATPPPGSDDSKPQN